ncbi:MAG: hypothetical protein ACKO37_06515 [Vampirovibrionales bacterium]
MMNSLEAVFKKLGITVEPEANAIPLTEELTEELRGLVDALQRISQERIANAQALSKGQAHCSVPQPQLWQEFIPWSSLN